MNNMDLAVTSVGHASTRITAVVTWTSSVPLILLQLGHSLEKHLLPQRMTHHFCIGDNIANFSVAISDWLAKCLKESLHELRKCTYVQMTRQTLRSFGEEWDATDARLPPSYIIV